MIIHDKTENAFKSEDWFSELFVKVLAPLGRPATVFAVDLEKLGERLGYDELGWERECQYMEENGMLAMLDVIVLDSEHQNDVA